MTTTTAPQTTTTAPADVAARIVAALTAGAQQARQQAGQRPPRGSELSPGQHAQGMTAAAAALDEAAQIVGQVGVSFGSPVVDARRKVAEREHRARFTDVTRGTVAGWRIAAEQIARMSASA